MAKKTIEIELVKIEAAYRRALKQVSYFFDHPPQRQALRLRLSLSS